jgi:hypothetical protein
MIVELQIWHDEPAVRVHGLDVSSLGFWLASDSTKDLPQSFSLLINARVFGVQVGSVTINPMKNETFTMPLLSSIGGTVDGRIDNWTAYGKGGQPIDNAADPHWKTATAVGFMITGLADVTISASTIASIIPGIGFLAKAALAILGNKVKISVAHQHVVVNLPHGTGAA